MSRYIGPKLRVIRRIGKLRGFTRKKPFRRTFRGRGPLKGRVIPPGQHGFAKLFKSSDSAYLIRLKVKQRLRFNYGLSERQLMRYVRKAKKNKLATGQVLLQMLEMRLDNIVFRLQMAPTIPAARQMIGHGHIRVNQKKVNIPSYICRPKDVISVAMKQASLKLVNRNLQEYYQRMRFYKNRLERTLAFVLFKAKWIGTGSKQSFANVLEAIRQGKVRINNRLVTKPDWVCKTRDTVSIQMGTTVRQHKLQDYFSAAAK
jgi:small subunit ribosomal protein S4